MLTKEEVEKHRADSAKHYEEWGGELVDKIIVQLCDHLLAAMKVVEAARENIYGDPPNWEDFEEAVDRLTNALQRYDELEKKSFPTSSTGTGSDVKTSDAESSPEES